MLPLIFFSLSDSYNAIMVQNLKILQIETFSFSMAFFFGFPVHILPHKMAKLNDLFAQ